MFENATYSRLEVMEKHGFRSRVLFQSAVNFPSRHTRGFESDYAKPKLGNTRAEM